MILKNILFIFFLFSSQYFLTPPPLKTHSISEFKNNNYSPTTCNVTNYDFTFIYDNYDKVFKVHGLWAEQCEECLECGYPYCCNTSNMSYVYPNEPNQIEFLNTRWFNATTSQECSTSNNSNNSEEVPLFEHEFFKHASCTQMRTTSAFLDLVMRLYDAYYVLYVVNKCSGYNQLWLNIDGNFSYNNVTKCLQ